MEVIIGRSNNYVSIFLKYLTNFQHNNSVRYLYHSHLIQNKWNRSVQSERRNDNLLKTTSPLLNLYSISTKKILLENNGVLLRSYCNKTVENEPKNASVFQKMKQLTQKMKQLFKDYWHIMIPVHLATSVVWVSIFYTAAKNGVDVISLMEYIHTPQKYIEIMKNTGAGNLAVTYALYKIFTPLRYMVTIGGTTMSIRYLNKRGYLKFKRPSTETTQSTKCDRKFKEKIEN